MKAAVQPRACRRAHAALRRAGGAVRHAVAVSLRGMPEFCPRPRYKRGPCPAAAEHAPRARGCDRDREPLGQRRDHRQGRLSPGARVPTVGAAAAHTCMPTPATVNPRPTWSLPRTTSSVKTARCWQRRSPSVPAMPARSSTSAAWSASAAAARRSASRAKDTKRSCSIFRSGKCRSRGTSRRRRSSRLMAPPAPSAASSSSPCRPTGWPNASPTHMQKRPSSASPAGWTAASPCSWPCAR